MPSIRREDELREKALVKMRKFADATMELSEAWEKYDTELAHIKKDTPFAENYPFSVSFDEIVIRIFDWLNSSEEEII